jgi:hypothetical protein
MTQFAVTHYERADRPTTELKEPFHTDDMGEADAKFKEWCKAGGPKGSGIFFFDYALFGGTTHKHVF